MSDDSSLDIDLAIRTLHLFNQKAEKLAGLRFTQYMGEKQSGFTISGQRQDDDTFTVQAERHGPDEEMIDAAVLTLRFFIQKREPISLRKMATLYQTLPISPKLLERFNAARDNLNGSLLTTV